MGSTSPPTATQRPGLARHRIRVWNLGFVFWVIWLDRELAKATELALATQDMTRILCWMFMLASGQIRGASGWSRAVRERRGPNQATDLRDGAALWRT